MRTPVLSVRDPSPNRSHALRRRARRPVGALGPAALIAPTGELDCLNAAEILAHVQRALAGHPGLVRLDMAQVAFMDCAALSALLTARRQCGLAGARMSVINASRPVRRILDLTGTGPMLYGEELQ